MRRVRCTVSPKQEWKHCRLAENHAASPSSSGSWSTLRAFFFYRCLLFCLLSSLVLFFVSNRALQTPQPPEGAIQKSAYFLPMNVGNLDLSSHAFPCVVLSYPPFILLSVFCFFVFCPLGCTLRLFVEPCLAFPPLIGRPHTLQSLCLSCRKKHPSRLSQTEMQ